MFKITDTFSSFSVNDAAKAQEFYENVLELKVEDNGMALQIHLPGGSSAFAYKKDDHQPATFTILNFEVGDIDEAVDSLVENGVVFEQYAQMTDDKGIARGISQNRGPDIAWFKDPAGNFLSVLHNE